jgi:hypothetical protein
MTEVLKEGEDFYYNEQGFVVLTAAYHLKKGYCCGNGCKHCPYDFENVPEPRRSEMMRLREEEEKKPL